MACRSLTLELTACSSQKLTMGDPYRISQGTLPLLYLEYLTTYIPYLPAAPPPPFSHLQTTTATTTNPDREKERKKEKKFSSANPHGTRATATFNNTSTRSSGSRSRIGIRNRSGRPPLNPIPNIAPRSPTKSVQAHVVATAPPTE